MKIINIIMLTALSFILCCVRGDRNNPFDANSNNLSHVMDIDGNVYQTVKIGNQIWTTENLRTTRLNDDTKISYIKRSSDWMNCSTSTDPAYCYYDTTTDTSFQKRYGALYNWYAVDSKKLAPKGWHVATKEDFDVLIKHLIDNGYNWDGTIDENKVAKSLASKTDWNTGGTNPGDVGNNLTSNNSSGFTGLPGGRRYKSFEHRDPNLHGHWWCGTEVSDQNAYRLQLSYHNDYTHWDKSPKFIGCSIRLVKD